MFVTTKFDKKYYKNRLLLDSTLIKNGKYIFTIKNFSDDFPKPYILNLEIEKQKSYVFTETFYIENKSKNIIFDSENGKLIKNIESTKIEEEKKNTTFFLKI